MKKFKKLFTSMMAMAMAGALLAGCGANNNGGGTTPTPNQNQNESQTPDTNEGNSQPDTNNGEVVELLWYQIGDVQSDMPMVLEKVNEYTSEKIGVTVKINQISWGDYTQKMQVIQNTGEVFDLAFTCSWANDYLQNAQRGVFLPLDDLLPTYGKEMYDSIDKNFWEAAKVNGVTYGVPNEKEIGSMPMWVFTKEYVDKYDIPYETIESAEDLEPWLQLIKENEPDVVPLYLTRDYSIPKYFDEIQSPVGVEYGDDNLTIQNIFETEKARSTIETMRKYYNEGYINRDASTATDDKSVKRFVTKGDGQPYAELIWSKDLGYDVVATPIMDTVVTNASARGSLTAVSQTSRNPEKAVEFLNLINSDEYLRNLLNYGIEGIHYEKVPLTDEEKAEVAGKPYVYDFRIRINPDKQSDYSVPTWVQGGLFNTYVMENEPADKWSIFKEFNNAAEPAPSFGFDFDAEPVMTEISGFQNVLDEFGRSLYTGTVDPEEYLTNLNEKLRATKIDVVMEEMQRQMDEWK